MCSEICSITRIGQKKNGKNRNAKTTTIASSAKCAKQTQFVRVCIFIKSIKNIGENSVCEDRIENSCNFIAQNKQSRAKIKPTLNCHVSVKENC